MNIKGIFTAVMAAMVLGVSAYAESDITVKYNGEILSFSQKPIIRSDKTLVQLRPIAEALGLTIDYIAESGQVILSQDETTVVFTNNSDIISINGRELQMIAPVVNHNDYTFVPVRDLAEPFGKVVSYDGETKTVDIAEPILDETFDEGADQVMEEASGEVSEETAEETSQQTAEDGLAVQERPEENPLIPEREVSKGSGNYPSAFFYQHQPDMALESNGRGYCWVCSYAMLLTNLKGETITPIQVANVNIEAGYAGNFMFHTSIAREFGCRFVPALSEDSAYFDGFDKEPRGATKLKFEEEQGLISALKEALDRNPAGVMVRYDGYPHTMLCVGYEGDTIYFNDPGLAEAEHVTFSETCLKNYKLTDITFIQAIEVE